MRKNYDFAKGVKNPYIKKIKSQGYKIEPDISLDLKDLIKLLPPKKGQKVRTISKEITDLKKRIEKLEKINKR